MPFHLVPLQALSQFAPSDTPCFAHRPSLPQLQYHSHAPPGEDEGVEDPALLMQVMEFREALEEASSEEEAEQVGQDNQGEMRHQHALSE